MASAVFLQVLVTVGNMHTFIHAIHFSMDVYVNEKVIRILLYIFVHFFINVQVNQ